jgi:pimeloyl-ACP methyl ester carboxylesterase
MTCLIVYQHHLAEPHVPKPISPPPLKNTLGEFFAIKDMLGIPLSLAKARFATPQDGHKLPVIVLPGIGADDTSTAPLRYFLSCHGYNVEGWGLGRNLAGRGMIKELSELSDTWDVDRTRTHHGEGEVPALCDCMVKRVNARTEALGSPVILIGWSLGGYVARETARELAGNVAGVITMGSPAYGGPKYTSAAPVFRRKNVDIDWIEQEVARRFDTPITQPITAIYSKRDGVVAWQASIDDQSPIVKHIEVNVTHVGLGLNADVWNIILDELRSKRFEVDFDS